MGFKLIRNPLFLVAVTVTMLFGATILGNFLGYARGYRHGQTVTNRWWIDKQSKYYDSVEVEKKRLNEGFNRL